MGNLKQLYQEKWVSFNLYFEDLDLLLSDSVSNIFEELEDNDRINYMGFNRSLERGKNLFLFFNISDEINETEFKNRIQKDILSFFERNPSPEKKINFPVNDWFLPYPNNFIKVNEHYYPDIMELGGIDAYFAGENLIPSNSHTVLSFIEAFGENWSQGNALGPAIQINLSFVSAFLKDYQEIKAFYEYCFKSIMDNINQGLDQTEKDALVQGLKSTFEAQAEQLSGFSGYILETVLEKEEFEDEWLNDWVEETSGVANVFWEVVQKGTYTIPEGYEVGLEGEYDSQIFWPVLEYYLRAFNAQFGIQDSYELNLFYSLKESLTILVEEIISE